MGISIFNRSKSSYDSQKSKEVDYIRFPNPDPNNFKIIKNKTIGKFLIILIKYPDCINFEGEKILIYKNWTIKKLKARNNLDPHFSNNEIEPSPIARFIPTNEGWEMAIKFCKMVENETR